MIVKFYGGEMKDIQQEYLIYYFKVLADDTRLRMVGYLARDEHNVQQLAALLGVREPTVSHHLSKMRSIGLVELRTEGNQHFYRLNQQKLAWFKQMVNALETHTPPPPEDADETWIEALPMEDWEKSVIRHYTFAGRLRQIPAKEKKLLVVLHWLSMQFEPEETYTEMEVNRILKQYHEDYATLRRSLISFGYLRRERGGTLYWVTPDEDALPPTP